MMKRLLAGNHKKSESIKKIKRNNKGATLVEMLVTFILLGIFMVAATRIISYTIGIYYAAKGNINGYQVSSMLYDKVSGVVENCQNAGADPIVRSDGKIYLTDRTGSEVNIGLTPADASGKTYLNIYYEPNFEYAGVNWKYDEKAYLGYYIKELEFNNPNISAEGVELKDGAGNWYYPENVIRMDMLVTSPKYGDFKTTYYLKCYNCEKVEFAY